MRAVEIEAATYRGYYDVVANQTLWFCIHGLWDLPRRPRFDRRWSDAWRAFREVNEQFASVAVDSASEGATVLVQDYQLALVPRILAERRPDLRVVAFMHTPWCSPEELAVLPDDAADELMEGLGSGSAVGFHCERWAGAFDACCRARLGRGSAGVFVAPATSDADDLRSVASGRECSEELARLEDLVGDRKVIVRVDRMELSKNVLRGFWAYDELLDARPELRERVIFAAKLYPSRQGVADYLSYAQEVHTLAERINDRWATRNWTPIVIDPEDNHAAAVAALRRADVLLVNPVRDGLNLVAKEGPLVNDRDGVLILSRNAGAWDELSEHALGVNPFDVSGTAVALGSALDMAADEKAERAKALRSVVEARTPLDWFDELLAAAAGQGGRASAPGAAGP
jgi:trehalose 6-phosphate synthase